MWILDSKYYMSTYSFPISYCQSFFITQIYCTGKQKAFGVTMKSIFAQFKEVPKIFGNFLVLSSIKLSG